MEFPDDYIVMMQDHWINFSYMMVEKKYALVRQTLYNYYLNPKSVMTAYHQFGNASGEKYLQQHLPGMKLVNGVLKTGKGTAEQRKEMEYLYIRTYYIFLLRAFSGYPYQEAKKIYEQLHAVVLECIPNYLHHPWLWPFNNGYEFTPSAVIYMLSLCERLHIIWPMGQAGLASRFTYKIR